jgi:hypothetical protein
MPTHSEIKPLQCRDAALCYIPVCCRSATPTISRQADDLGNHAQSERPVTWSLLTAQHDQWKHLPCAALYHARHTDICRVQSAAETWHTNSHVPVMCARVWPPVPCISRKLSVVISSVIRPQHQCHQRPPPEQQLSLTTCMETQRTTAQPRLQPMHIQEAAAPAALYACTHISIKTAATMRACV